MTTTTNTNPAIAKLIELGVDKDIAQKLCDDLGAETVEHLSQLELDDLLKAGIKKLPAKNLLDKLKPTAAPAAPQATTDSPVNFDGVLPSVPLDQAWLEALRTGGILKVDESTVLSAIRAALADRYGLYAIPELLEQAMLRYADSADEQVGPEFFRLRRLVTQRSYGDLFAAIDGLDGKFMTKTRKDELIRRINQHLWPSLYAFNEQLKSWQEAWMQGAANPGVMMMGMLNNGRPLPPGMMQPPDTTILRDAAESVFAELNKVFRGTGVQVTAALAYEAQQIMDLLKNPDMPKAVGVNTQEMMLKQLDVSVPPTYPRMEQNVIRFALAILRVKKLTSGDEELRFYGALYMLGNQISWSELMGHVNRVPISPRPSGLASDHPSSHGYGKNNGKNNSGYP